MIRVLIVDDQELVRAGFRMILEVQPDIDVVGEAADGVAAVAAAANLAPHVVLMDVRMPEADGIDATRRIFARAIDTRVLILTTFDADEYVYDAIRAGASGFLLKNAPPAQLVAAVRAAAAGETHLAPEILQRMVDEFVRNPRPGTGSREAFAHLTDRELEVLKLVARGLNNADIARHLFLSEATIRTHVSRILSKLGLRDRTQAVVAAYEGGLVKPGGAAPSTRGEIAPLGPD
jgi:DNA-binding NarL/FixJ family response regulator